MDSKLTCNADILRQQSPFLNPGSVRYRRLVGPVDAALDGNQYLNRKFRTLRQLVIFFKVRDSDTNSIVGLIRLHPLKDDIKLEYKLVCLITIVCFFH
jgi:hypothetical protein